MSEAHTGPDKDISDDIALLRERVVELQATVEQQQERIAELEDEVASIDERTDLFNLIDATDTLDAEQRSAALLQHMHREAKQGDGTAVVNRERAETILHNPDIDRTTYYTDFRRCEEMIGDDDVCKYRGDTNPARLELDLRNGTIPTKFHGDQRS